MYCPYEKISVKLQRFGLFPLRGKIDVAIRALKGENGSPAEEEMMREAEIRRQLDNPYIVHILGLCYTEDLCMVMEIAPVGPLNKFLSTNE